MGVEFLTMESYYQYGKEFDNVCFPKQVRDLAIKVIEPILERNNLPISHLVVATTCPDSIAPSVGQEICRYFSQAFSNTHTIDIVQGCAGGVTALLLGNKFAENNNKAVMVVMSDAAKKACDRDSKNYKIFGNGSFACLLSSNNSKKGLLHSKSRQYQELTEVVHVKLGHDADVILDRYEEVRQNPRKYLGLKMNNDLAISLLRKAKGFYEEFIEEINMEPDIIILHQVNPKIVAYLEKIFQINDIKFINVSEIAGNCGAASVGIALKHGDESLSNKKVLICSFGTGGVITAGLWQF
ncbi:3-oxoacyl-[acyl-carrier-protein] synthase III C-terminal domain-containing protein [Aestuariivivens sediminicola]|uniref:3-oxoacyl-[acyl-carrier-protein] synthase III C-terminal domain-containing protein n=1 Tax=Aestuariivivens sediminicola TaxID=2913560 RepID=UPI001F58F6A2|nr:3-oxoacyl-[acyl-carrier-protein] synthase III C-terminal domain-containing protein [Aestuariivivens sediminicola]